LAKNKHQGSLAAPDGPPNADRERSLPKILPDGQGAFVKMSRVGVMLVAVGAGMQGTAFVSMIVVMVVVMVVLKST
jgi:hypothetical protein